MAFYIDKKGKRVRTDWSISWEGSPTAFAFRFPYVVAFNSNFIEVRHMDTVSYRIVCVYASNAKRFSLIGRFASSDTRQ